MLSLFRKTNGRKQDTEKGSGENLAGNLPMRVIRLQERCATFMQKQTERLSFKGKLMLLALFCLLSGSLSIYLFTRSLMGHHPASISVSNIKAPLYGGKPGDENARSSLTITKQEYERIKYFRQYMDSLALSPSGKPLYDSIQRDRPGLIDSIALVEKFYQSQIK